eukprot:9493498-Pyramimonas_sp.AAC.3
MAGVLRSKGFVWIASNNDTAYYWAHAGLHFQVHGAKYYNNWNDCNDCIQTAASTRTEARSAA